MPDIFSKHQRSVLMSKVRGADTKPEWILRCGLHRIGFRYRLGNRHLPGRPDLVFPKYRSIVFVHGCYWHRHSGCKDASIPKSNVDFWTRKFAENIKRDQVIERDLRNRGWRVMVVWECELVRNTVETIEKVAGWLHEGKVATGRVLYSARVVDRGTLLAVAEAKVRYRIATYDDKPEPNGSEGPED